MEYFWVTLGSAAGGLARFVVSDWVTQKWGGAFPWGTLAVNASGSFIIGLLAALTLAEGRLASRWHPLANQFLMLGVCGGYTTFSSFSLQTLNLARAGEWLQAGGNIGASLLTCLAGVWLGFALGQILNR